MRALIVVSLVLLGPIAAGCIDPAGCRGDGCATPQIGDTIAPAAVPTVFEATGCHWATALVPVHRDWLTQAAPPGHTIKAGDGGTTNVLYAMGTCAEAHVGTTSTTDFRFAWGAVFVTPVDDQKASAAPYRFLWTTDGALDAALGAVGWPTQAHTRLEVDERPLGPLDHRTWRVEAPDLHIEFDHVRTDAPADDAVEDDTPFLLPPDGCAVDRLIQATPAPDTGESPFRVAIRGSASGLSHALDGAAEVSRTYTGSLLLRPFATCSIPEAHP